jgi:hypothetical protein
MCQIFTRNSITNSNEYWTVTNILYYFNYSKYLDLITQSNIASQSLIIF